jgi:hypothetical protein
VTKTRNLKTDMTEFQWWWSIFLKYKSVLPRHFSYGWIRKEIERKFIKRKRTRLISSSLSAIESRHFRLISNRESHDSVENWNILLRNLIDVLIIILKLPPKNVLFSDKTLINFSLFFYFGFSCLKIWNSTEKKRKTSWNQERAKTGKKTTLIIIPSVLSQALRSDTSFSAETKQGSIWKV